MIIFKRLSKTIDFYFVFWYILIIKINTNKSKGVIITKKVFIKVADKIVSGALKMNVNSTTSLAAYQPKMPVELKKLSNVK